MTREYVRLEVRRTLRDPGFVIFSAGMPVLMYLLFTNLGAADDGAAAWRTTAMVGMAAYGALGAAVSVGTGISEDRSLGWLRQLRVTPLRPRQVVLGRAVTSSVTVAPAILTVLAAGAIVNGVRLDAWRWALLVLLLWAGTLPFTLLGIGNGYRLSAQSAGVVNTGALMGMAVLGGLWFPIEAFPDWLRSVAAYTPAHGFAELGWAATGAPASALTALAVVLGWLAVFGSYAVMSYRTSARTT